MIITCKRCQTRFRVDGSLIKKTGTRVRCSNCQNVFTVFLPEHAGSQIPPAPPADGGAGAYEGAPDADVGAPGAYGGDPGAYGAAPSPPAAPPAQEQDPNSGSASGGTVRQLAAKPIVPATSDIIVPPELLNLRESQPESAPAKTFILESRAEARSAGGPAAVPAGTFTFEPGERGGASPPDYDEDAEEEAEERPEEAPVFTGAHETTSPEDINPSPSGREAPYQAPAPPASGDLGLSSDPANPAKGAEESSAPFVEAENSPNPVYPLFDPEKAAPSGPIHARDPLRPGKLSSGRNKIILLAAAVLSALFIVAILFLTLKPAPDSLTAVQGTGPAGEDAGGGAPTEDRGPQGSGTSAASETDKLNFKEDETSHYIRTNLAAGKLLIITGRITNDFSDMRSFIRVRGLLKNPDGIIEAERQAYAGNYLSETELTALPINEILSRLAIKGGQNGLNVNLLPGNSISFMLVFDKIPDDLTGYEYVVDVVSSQSAGPPPEPAPAAEKPEAN
ncbi:MAG: zinc-ribbon domain-containing protein [Deltaproteobacteria bacterium]|jgi:predicted Zn finger-like uncharacterized protein|nr:zinc-ribbon domain-containing protein [Deltaproteobacteria bacterium]